VSQKVSGKIMTTNFVVLAVLLSEHTETYGCVD